MATYRIVNMYRKSKAIKGIHYDSWNEPIFAFRVDKRHSLLFGLIHYWDYGAYVAGYLDKKYIILGFDNFDGCISTFTPRVCTYVKIYNSYRFAKLKYLEVIKHQ